MSVKHLVGSVKWEVEHVSLELRGEIGAFCLDSKILENRSNSP